MFKKSLLSTKNIQLAIIYFQKIGAHIVIIFVYQNMVYAIIRGKDECYCKVSFKFRGQDNSLKCSE